MSDFDPAQIESGLESLAAVDFAGALTAFRTGNVGGMIQTGEQLATLLSPFIPDVIYAKDALEVAGFLVDMQNAGWIAPAKVEDPALERAAGHGGVGRDHA